MVNKLIYPQEIEVWHILPSIRRALALQMIKKGIEQKKIASLLGVTESAISQYLSKKRASEITFNRKLKKEILISANKILKNRELALSEIQHILNLPEIKEKICVIHKKYKGVKNNCNICLQ